jgi:hypothetical protein
MENQNNRWRFPASNHATVQGISSSNKETFKGSHLDAFAREILQNSIDARASDELPVRVDFNEFEIFTKDIPGIEQYKDAVRRCEDYWRESQPAYLIPYNEILNELKEDKIKCLRISDFNTIGLKGISSDDPKENNYLAMIKGSGVSEKGKDVSGGSKGIGKNAAFLLSKLNMVFYSTRTASNESGHIGVADLISGFVDDNKETPNRDYTQGPGYFCSDEINHPIRYFYSLDPSYNREVGETGTDIYIIGLEENENLASEIKNGILESFMAAIARGDLAVSFNDEEFNKETLKLIDFANDPIYKNNKASLISQFRILSGDKNVKTFDIDTEFGTANLYVLPFSKEEADLATHKCTMIRHPLMKIKEFPASNIYNVSAICIIGKDKLGGLLRKAETPQHNNWDKSRVSDKAVQNEIKSVLNTIQDEISDDVSECFKGQNNNPIDPLGAGEYISDENDITGNSDGSKQKDKDGQSFATKAKPCVPDPESNSNYPDDNGQGGQPDLGSENDEGEDNGFVPDDNNDGHIGPWHPSDHPVNIGPGDTVVLKKAPLTGIHYKVVSVNRLEGLEKIVFYAPKDENECYLSIYLVDDVNQKSIVQILSLSKNGLPIASTSNVEYGPFSISNNEKVVLLVKTDTKDYFANEVKITVCE